MLAALVVVWVLALASLGHAATDVRVEVHPQHQVNWECKSRWPGNALLRARIIGCAVFTVERGRVVCTLILPKGFSDRLYRHERGHCYGGFHGY